MPSRIAMLSTYPPTQCGIATFARSMSRAMANLGQQVDLVRISPDYTAKVAHPVTRNHVGAEGVAETVKALNSYDAFNTNSVFMKDLMAVRFSKLSIN